MLLPAALAPPGLVRGFARSIHWRPCSCFGGVGVGAGLVWAPLARVRGGGVGGVGWGGGECGWHRLQRRRCGPTLRAKQRAWGEPPSLQQAASTSPGAAEPRRSRACCGGAKQRSHGLPIATRSAHWAPICTQGQNQRSQWRRCRQQGSPQQGSAAGRLPPAGPCSGALEQLPPASQAARRSSGDPAVHGGVSGGGGSGSSVRPRILGQKFVRKIGPQIGPHNLACCLYSAWSRSVCHSALQCAGDGTHVEPASQHEQQAAAANGGRPPRVSFRQPKAQRSSWDAKEAGGGRSADADYLFELGASQQCELSCLPQRTASASACCVCAVLCCAVLALPSVQRGWAPRRAVPYSAGACTCTVCLAPAVPRVARCCVAARALSHCTWSC